MILQNTPEFICIIAVIKLIIMSDMKINNDQFALRARLRGKALARTITLRNNTCLKKMLSN